jgi:hypothetical protein
VKELMPLVVSKLDFKSWLLHQQKEHCVPKAGEGLGKLHSEENKMTWQNLHKAQAEGDELTKQPKLGSQVALKMLKEAHNREPLDWGPATVSAEHSQCDVALSMLARDLAVPTYLEIAKPGVDSTNTVFQDAPGGLLLWKNGWGSHLAVPTYLEIAKPRSGQHQQGLPRCSRWTLAMEEWLGVPLPSDADAPHY